jgi:ribosomal-protein-alanine N-acetyltransferase
MAQLRASRSRLAISAPGARVFLRKPRRADEAEFLELRRRSWEFLAPWEPDMPGIDPLGAAMYARYMRFGARHRRLRLLVCARRSGRIRGSISIGEIDRELGSATIGYWVGARFARRGYMSEALGLALAHAFGRLGIATVSAYVLPENTPSKRLLARLGFERSGTAPAYRAVGGRPRDHERWTIQRPQSRR